MKCSSLVASLVAVFLSPLVLATQANLFECVGKDSQGQALSLSYTRSSLRAVPTLSLTVEGRRVLPIDPQRQTALFEDTQTLAGTLVSVATNHKDLADAPDLLTSVLIPNVILDPMGPRVPFQAVLLRGYSGGFRRRPLVVQVLTSLDQLDCHASLVDF